MSDSDLADVFAFLFLKALPEWRRRREAKTPRRRDSWASKSRVNCQTRPRWC